MSGELVRATARPWRGATLGILAGAALGWAAWSAEAPSRAVMEGRTDLPRFPEVPAGIEYVHRRTGDQPWSVHVLRIARKAGAGRFEMTLGRDAVVGLETVRAQAARVSAGGGRAVAGVNGDFFVIRPGPYQGDPRGLQIMEGELVSAPEGTVAFWVEEEGRPRMETVYSRLHVVGPGGREWRVGLNQERTNGMAVLYTPRFGPSTRTTNGLEVVLGAVGEGAWVPLGVGQRYAARVVRVASGADTPIEAGHVVLSMAPAVADEVGAVAVGDRWELVMATTPGLKGVQMAVSGGPVLIRAGEIQQWRPPQPRHPRTALGWNETHYVLAVVDGRQPGLSVGMTFPELAALMLELGCREAMNLDGGGSSTMWLRDRVMNSPSDGRERPVANALLWVEADDR